MAVLGGMRSFSGTLIGATVFVVLQDYLSSQTRNWMWFVGLFVVLVVLLAALGGALFLAYWHFDVPRTAVEKVLPDARFPK